MSNWLSQQIGKIDFSALGNTASIISLIITVYLFYAVRKIKSFYVSKARVPELIRELKEHASHLAEFHRDFEDSSEQVLLEIGKAEVTLKSLRNKVQRPTRKSVSRVLKLIKTYTPFYRTKDNLWKIYVEMQKLIQEIAGAQSDRDWENPNG